MFGNKAEAYPLCVRIGHGLHEPVELVAHGFRSNTSGSAFEMLHVRITRHGQREWRARRRAMHTMWDTPLVRGERGAVFAEEVGRRLDMSQEREVKRRRVGSRIGTQGESLIFI